MKRYLPILFALLTLFGCRNNQPEKEPLPTPPAKEPNIADSLASYFSRYKIDPTLVINNKEAWGSDTVIAGHRLNWMNTDEETKLRIGNDLFSLKREITLNNVWGEDPDSVDFANYWDQIKYYKHKGRELLAIRMSFEPCTGLGCSVNYFLVYDLQQKTKNFFGTFRIGNELELYDFPMDDKLDYVSTTFRGDAHGATNIDLIYELFSLDAKGHFIRQKDPAGKPYHITLTTTPADTLKDHTRYGTHWFEPINSRP